MSYDGYYRRGDVVRFRRGSNVYVGTVVRIFGVLAGLEVQAEGIGGVRVAMKHVEQLVTPKLTDKERTALLELLPESGSVTLADLNGFRRAKDLPLVSGTTMHSLAERGLVTGMYPNVSSTTGPLVWRLTEEGRRVARGL